MKKRIILSLIIFIATVGIGLGLSFAWYTGAQRTGKIKISSDGITMTYTLNDDDEINVETFEIDKIVFFDVDSGSSYDLEQAAGTKVEGTKYYSRTQATGTYDKTKTYYKITGNLYSTVDSSLFDNTTDVTDYYLISQATGTYVSGKEYYSFSNGVYSLVTTLTRPGVDPVTGYFLIENATVFSSNATYYSISGYRYNEVDITSFTEDSTSVSDYYLISDITNTISNSASVSSYFIAKDRRHGESKYLSKSSVLIELNISNANEFSTDVTVTGGTSNISSPYVYSFISTTEVDTSSSNRMVNSYLKVNSLSNEKEVTIASGQTTKLYVYVYGVQPNDAANNTFLSNTYTFEITIVAEKSSS